MKPILEVHNLSKEFTIFHQQSPYVNLRDRISTILKSSQKEQFWALRDVDFNVMPGESIGIIGRNGAGKSTLLKIMSRITPPTKGKIVIRGRIAALLEVGTGFHQELTGRENVFMNGSILGMKRAEIKLLFDEIVEFSGTSKFIDTPIKHYSSGMQLRLAFAVSANLRADILIIDEVLAVGDVEFQKKCLGKMEDVTKSGRTVLFVSHNMNTIESLCSKAILLNEGKVEFKGTPSEVIYKYLYNNSDEKIVAWRNSGKQYTNEYFFPLEFKISCDSNGSLNNVGVFSGNANVTVHLSVEIKNANSLLNIGYALYTEEGVLLYWTFIRDIKESESINLTNATYAFIAQLPPRFLNEGVYYIEMIGAIHHKFWILHPGGDIPRLFFEIKGGLSDSPYFVEKRQGLLAPVIDWSIQKM